MKKQLTHLNAAGEAQMVDVGGKTPTRRRARAGGRITMSADAFQLLCAGNAPKGDVLATARLAAIGAAKRTAELIPLCHLLPLEKVEVAFTPSPDSCSVVCEVTVATTAKTGVEMEALVGVQTGLITIYDMLKAVDRGMVIDGVRLLEKEGGASGVYKHD